VKALINALNIKHLKLFSFLRNVKNFFAKIKNRKDPKSSTCLRCYSLCNYMHSLLAHTDTTQRMQTFAVKILRNSGKKLSRK
jgi:hypothetical protein